MTPTIRGHLDRHTGEPATIYTPPEDLVPISDVFYARLVQMAAAAISDPGATTPRLPNEHVSEWTARAVLAALAVRS